MKTTITKWQIAGFFFVAIAGVLLHFSYDWSNQSPLFAPFSAVNESIWEHMKLLFYPMFLFALIQHAFIGEDYENFWNTKLVGILFGLILIPILYYTYTGVSGAFADWVNIAIFFIAAATSYWLETKLFNSNHTFYLSPSFALLLLCALAFIFVVLTYIPPQIPLFQDPATGGYGLLRL